MVARREEPPIDKNLESLTPRGADGGKIADSAVEAWTAIDGALSPIVGARGVAALYKRSVHLAVPEHPWLAPAYEGALQPGNYASLRAALSRQTGANAAAAHDAILQTFQDLLNNLIGQSLSQRLLLTARSHLQSVPPSRTPSHD